jgi:hypothetical protein
VLRACASTLPAYGDRIPGCGKTLIPIPGGRGYVCPKCDGPAAAAIAKEK